jgi:hypothetical protein
MFSEGTTYYEKTYHAHSAFRGGPAFDLVHHGGGKTSARYDDDHHHPIDCA